jgi:hypothetical protein
MCAEKAIAEDSCHTDLVSQRITIAVREEVARWVRKKASEEDTSGSKLVGRMIEDEMRRTGEHRAAYESWKKPKPIKEEAHKRR